MSLRPNTHLKISQIKMEPYKQLESLHDQYNNPTLDDDTVQGGNKYTSTRIQIMVSTQITEKSAEALLLATRELMAALRNKLPEVKFAKWNDKEAAKTGKNISTQIPKEVEKAEEFIQNFSRFSKKNKGYFRIQLIHDEALDEETILETGKSFNVAQQQSIYKAPSQAILPVTIGLLSGTTETMTESLDLMELLKITSKVQVIGLSWRYIQTGQKGKYNNDQKAIYVETESGSASELKSFLHSTLNDQQILLFGSQVTFIPSGTYPTKQQLSKLQKYAPVQANLVANMRESVIEISTFKPIKVQGTEEDTPSLPLIEALLKVQSIVSKQGIKRDKIISFYGNVFYSAITNAETNNTTFQYLAVNENEATSILRAFPLFIRDYFKINEKEATHYCRSSLTTSAKNGQWEPDTRTFLSHQDIKEQMYFENLQLITQATPSQQFIDPNHQRALQTGNNDADTVETNLHRKDAHEGTSGDNREMANNGEASTLTDDTGSTRTSKAKKFAEEARKEMMIQLNQQKKRHEKEINKHKIEKAAQAEDMEKRDQQINKLEAMMAMLLQQQNQQRNNEVGNKKKDTPTEVISVQATDNSDEDEDNFDAVKNFTSDEEEVLEVDRAKEFEVLEFDYYNRNQSEDSDDELASIKAKNSNWKQKMSIITDRNLEEVSDHQDPNGHNHSDKVPVTNNSPKRKLRSQSTNTEQNKRTTSGGPRGSTDW